MISIYTVENCTFGDEIKIKIFALSLIWKIGFYTSKNKYYLKMMFCQLFSILNYFEMQLKKNGKKFHFLWMQFKILANLANYIQIHMH